MILNGMQHTRIRQNGRTQSKWIVAVLILLLILSGCSVDWWIGDGRGDWTCNLINGYAITKVNSREIVIVHKESFEATNGEFVIQNYFVTAYQIHDRYICLEGISTDRMTLSDEELKENLLNYYLIDTLSNEISGPFVSKEAFCSHCDSISIRINGEWNKTDY